MTFAARTHAAQVRKYTGDAYFAHLAEVAGIVSTVRRDASTIATAYLHDCMEDQGVTSATLIEKFGHEIACGVLFLSDLEKGNRAARKSAARARLSAAPDWVQDIKVGDIISNAPSIAKHDPDFAKVFLGEARMLLAALTKADRRLLDFARDIITRHE